MATLVYELEQSRRGNNLENFTEEVQSRLGDSCKIENTTLYLHDPRKRRRVEEIYKEVYGSNPRRPKRHKHRLH